MYNRQKAVEYAFEWWNKRNPNFYDFDDLGGDCTNFVSQCLYFGGIEMNYSQQGWFYINLNNRAPSWTGVEDFFYFATTNNMLTGVKAKLCDIENMQIGDIVQLKLNGEDRFHHSLIVTKIDFPITPANLYLTSHTYDAINRPLENYFVENVRYLKVLN